MRWVPRVRATRRTQRTLHAHSASVADVTLASHHALPSASDRSRRWVVLAKVGGCVPSQLGLSGGPRRGHGYQTGPEVAVRERSWITCCGAPGLGLPALGTQ